MELIFELLFEVFFSGLILKLLYYITIRPLVVMVGYISFSTEDMDNRPLKGKNTLSWDKLENIGWQSLSDFLGILLAILIIFILFCWLN